MSNVENAKGAAAGGLHVAVSICIHTDACMIAFVAFVYFVEFLSIFLETPAQASLT